MRRGEAPPPHLRRPTALQRWEAWRPREASSCANALPGPSEERHNGSVSRLVSCTVDLLCVNKQQAKKQWRHNPDQTCSERPLPGI